jgi:hypothetical protein
MRAILCLASHTLQSAVASLTAVWKSAADQYGDTGQPDLAAPAISTLCNAAASALKKIWAFTRADRAGAGPCYLVAGGMGVCAKGVGSGVERLEKVHEDLARA